MRAIHLAILVLLPTTLARAASPEEAYIAARDRAIGDIKRTEKTLSPEAWSKKQDVATTDLLARLKSVIGEISLPGLPATAKLNNDTLSASDEGFGKLDGLLFATEDYRTSAVVTTEGLLKRWLTAHRNWWKGLPNPPVGADAALKSTEFYTQGLSADAQVVKFADLPVGATTGSTRTHALLAARTQDMSPRLPDEFYISVARDGRVIILNARVATPITPIAACDVLKSATEKRIQAFDESSRKNVMKGGDYADTIDKLRMRGDAEYLKCFAERASGEPFYEKAVAEARALIDAFTGARAN